MTTGTLFNQLKAGKITKEKFLYEVRRDVNLPFISPLTTFAESIKILQNRGIVTEVYEMGPAESSEKCSCGGNYEPHEDAGELVCASCGERAPISENEDDYDPFYDREEEINYGAEEDEKPVPDDFYADEDNMEEDDAEFEDILAKTAAEKQGQEDVLGQYDLEEDEMPEAPSEEDTYANQVYENVPSLREQVQEFVKNALKGGSSMDEAKSQAREFFATKDALNEAVKPKLTMDQVNPYEFKKGVNIEMGVDKSAAPDWSSYLGDLANDIKKAQAKVLKNLSKDPAYYTNQIAGKHKEKKPGAVKADGYLKVAKSKMEKSNVQTTLSKTEGAKGNPQGVKMMKEGAFQKIKEYVTKQLKKETKLVKSVKTGETIDVVPDAQAQTMQTALQKKGVRTTSTNV